MKQAFLFCQFKTLLDKRDVKHGKDFTSFGWRLNMFRM